MGNSLTVDISKRIADATFVKAFEIPDRFGPIKYDIPDQIWRTYLELLPAVAQRIDAIEQHLEKGIAEGRSFVRPQERPDVGGGAVNDLSEQVRQLNQRLEKIEARAK
jgi:ubiquinone biosynthesis protein UbiJ